MIILGLGSNKGDRFFYLREAINKIRALPQTHVLHISPVYLSEALLPENAAAEWNKPFLNIAIACESEFAPLELLAQIKKIERELGRDENSLRWSPRTIDIDILCWDELIITTDTLTIPKPALLERPFALWPLADIAPFWQYPLPGAAQGKTAAELVEKWGSRFTAEAPLHTKQIYQRIRSPQLVGVLNVTPDSFSDGGQFFSVDAAVQQAIHLVESGAEIIDIGAESTAPTAAAVTPQKEWARLEPLLIAIKALQATLFITPRISVDTRHAFVAEQALALGVDWINDVSGLDDPAMREVVAATQADCVVMHHLNIPERRAHVLPRAQDPVALVLAWGEQRLRELEHAGIARERVIFDPGIGFGKMAEQSLAVLKNITAFRELGVRILVGHSRKSFLSLFTEKMAAERDIETLAATLFLAQQNIDYVRVHQVELCARALRVVNTLNEPNTAIQSPEIACAVAAR